MAALDDSPSRCQGQPWTVWADRLGLSEKLDESDDEEDGKSKREGDAMKLRKEDMSLFGFCPAQDDFYLVVCGLCEQVIKPQALQSHMELRHREDSRRTHRASPKPREAPHRNQIHPATSSSRSQHPEKDNTQNPSAPTANTTSCPSPSPAAPLPQSTNTRLQRASSTSSTQLSRHGTPAQGPGKGEGPQAKTKANGNHSSNPVVRVERIPSNLMPRKGPKREVPSPQQPPPPFPASPVGTAGLPAVAVPCSGAAGPILANSNHVVSKAVVALAAKKAVLGNGVEGKPRPAAKSKSRVPTERKLLPCKDRVYDADKHCGVWVVDIAKPCTRSLTCKTHSLAMRRNVAGRRKNFDELLADHRAAKEAEVAAKAAANKPGALCPPVGVPQPPVHPNSRTVPQVLSTGKGNAVDGKRSTACPAGEGSGGSRRKPSWGTLPPPVPKANSVNPPCLSSPSNQKPVPSSNGKSKATGKPATGNSTQLRPTNSTSVGAEVRTQCQQLTDTGPKIEAVAETAPQPRKECRYVGHHPRPAAVCTFNARLMGTGFYVCDRRLDGARTALRAALGERHSYGPPIKKLCVESRLPPMPEPSDPSDPYSFTCNDHVVPKAPSAAQVSSTSTACLPAPPQRPVSLPVPLLQTLVPCPSVPDVLGSPTGRCPSPSKPPSAAKKAPSKARANRDSTQPTSAAKRKRTSVPNSVLVTPGTGGPSEVLSVSFPVNLTTGVPLAHPAKTNTGTFGDVNLLVTNVGVVNGQLRPSAHQGKGATGFGCAASPAMSTVLTGPRKGKGTAGNRGSRGTSLRSPTLTMAVLGGGMGALSNAGLLGGVTPANNHVVQVSPSGKSPNSIGRAVSPKPFEANVANSNARFHFAKGSLSPQVLTNGLGSSPAPLFSKMPPNHNHVGRANTPSPNYPGADLGSPTAAEGRTPSQQQRKGPRGWPLI